MQPAGPEISSHLELGTFYHVTYICYSFPFVLHKSFVLASPDVSFTVREDIERNEDILFIDEENIPDYPSLR